MANVLKKITTEAKRIRKSKPKTSWKSAVKQAGAKYRAGKIRVKRKVVRKKTVRRKAVKRKSAPRKRRSAGKVVRKRAFRRVRPAGSPVLFIERGQTKRSRPKRVYRVKRTKAGRYSGVRRVAGRGKMMNSILLFGGLALGAYLLLRPKQPLYLPTGDVARDSKASQILQYAQAAGLAATQIANLIAKLNQQNANVDVIYEQAQSGNFA